MSKKCYRYFGGLLNTQAKWLNKMAEKGYRLVRTGKLLYEFEKCKPDEVTYCVEFIGEKSKESSIDYANFLEDIGYKVFFKNINLNYSVGKARWRPWAERGGRIATNATTFNRELLIVEKANDGKPFELHTSYDDKKKKLSQLTQSVAISTAHVCTIRSYKAIYNLWYFCVGFCNSWQYISNTDNENPEGSQDTGMVRK